MTCRDALAMDALRTGKVTSLVFEARNAFSADEPLQLHGPKWHATTPMSAGGLRTTHSSDDPTEAVLGALPTKVDEI